ncbi:MAG: ribonuclease HII [Firmicutes bacterium]|nr:ribonuclease HII [Bacillota bacterium]
MTTKEERLRRQQEKVIEMKRTEEDLHRQGIRFVAGVDEVGRGPLAGPVVTAAVVLPENFDVPGIDDSKKLSEKRREELYDIIMDRALAVGLGQSDWRTIDEVNILQATKLAMFAAIDDAREDLRRRTGEESAAIGRVLLDAVTLEGLDIPQHAIIKGDGKVLCIAAASIIAKVTRDRMMVAWAEEYPYYAFEKNKGYGTKAHYEGLREHGPCPIHRRTFIKNMH